METQRPRSSPRALPAPGALAAARAPGRRLVAAMSGGVDSSVAALLLQRQGYELVGLFMRNGIHVEASESSKKSCCSTTDARDARMVAAHLGIPFQSVDLSEEFGAVIRYFLAEYGRGRTPNPCAVCNRDLKFGRLLDLAHELGAEGVATGHYARLEVQEGRVVVRRGVDASKDQSYQLFAVAEADLARTHLPLGGLHKSAVRALAAEVGLRTAHKRDSQEICFVPGNDYRALLAERGVQLHPGRIVDTAGSLLGEHSGTEHFTIGQRRGLGVASGAPLYVVALEPESGTVVLGGADEAGAREMHVADLNWIGVEPPAGALACRVQVRYHHRAAPARLELDRDGLARVEFDEPQSALTPGQGAAFYLADVGGRACDERLIGGGWITRPRGAARCGA